MRRPLGAASATALPNSWEVPMAARDRRLEQALARAERALAEARELLATADAPQARAPAVSMVTIGIAAERTGWHRETIRRWCEREGIGQKYDRVWFVDLVRLRQRQMRRRA
jgi:hypothetical protein